MTFSEKTKINKFYLLLKYVRLKPFEQDSLEGRAAERYRRSIITSGANVLSKVLAMLVMVMSVTWTLPYLGEERFGVWMTVASMAALLSFMDLGVGNALTNRVAYLASIRDRGDLRRGITGGLLILFFISVFSGALLLTVASLIDWGRLFKLTELTLQKEAEETVLIFTFFFTALTFLNGVGRVFHGLQRGFITHLASMFGSILSLICLRTAVIFEASTPLLVACVMGGLVAGNLGLIFILFKEKLIEYQKLSSSLLAERNFILKTGGLFFLLQIGTMVAWGADSVIIASASGAAAVASYSIIQRLNQFVTQPIQVINAPLWSAYADAISLNERSFIRRTFVRSIILSFVASTIGATMLFIFGQDLIFLWTKGEITVSITLLGLMAIWLILEATGGALGVFLNGIGVVKQQVMVVSVFILIGLPLKIFLASTNGAEGVVLAGIFSYLLTTILGYGFIFRNQIKELVH